MTEFQNNNKYNLEERTAKFGEISIDFCTRLKQDAVTRPLISQLVRSATSIGANYAEANGASSKIKFIYARKNRRKLNIGYGCCRDVSRKRKKRLMRCSKKLRNFA